MWVHLKKFNLYLGVGVAALGISMAPTKSLASYLRPVPQHDSGTIDVQAILQSQYSSHQNLHYSNVPDSVVDYVLKDTDHQIGTDFQVPSELRNSVEFWL